MSDSTNNQSPTWDPNAPFEFDEQAFLNFDPEAVLEELNFDIQNDQGQASLAPSTNDNGEDFIGLDFVINPDMLNSDPNLLGMPQRDTNGQGHAIAMQPPPQQTNGFDEFDNTALLPTDNTTLTARYAPMAPIAVMAPGFPTFQPPSLNMEWPSSYNQLPTNQYPALTGFDDFGSTIAGLSTPRPTRPMLEEESPERSPESRPSAMVSRSHLQKYYSEKPQKSDMGRVNEKTQGLNSRTGKINHYNPEEMYEEIPHPLGGQWSTKGGKRFQYNRWGELSRAEFPFNMLKEFILQHPQTENSMLILYIQRGPADSMRRKKTKDSAQCRFAECPMRRHNQKGNISHGHYRVALDELSFAYGPTERNDPMVVAGYVHLYCLERYLDLPTLCQLPNVRVIADGRNLSKEPQGKFHAALQGNDYSIAVDFVNACQKGTFRNSDSDFKDYPLHEETRVNGARVVKPKDHTKTLNYSLQIARNSERSRRVRAAQGASNVAVHLGDLEIFAEASHQRRHPKKDGKKPVRRNSQASGTD